MFEDKDKNIFPFMKMTKLLAKSENLNPGKILSEMTSKDVHHFIDTFNKYFRRLCKMELKDERVKLIVKLKTIDEFNYKIGADK